MYNDTFLKVRGTGKSLHVPTKDGQDLLGGELKNEN